MKIKLIRREFSGTSTIGDLMINDIFFCYTLEDTVLPEGVKIYGQTAIPYGTYEVITNYSVRFKKVMPLLLDVPHFEGIRIHAGNTSADTEGCILLGLKKNIDWIGDSKKAFDSFMVILQAALSAGLVTIEIVRGE